jgi:hypothetical protein
LRASTHEDSVRLSLAHHRIRRRRAAISLRENERGMLRAVAGLVRATLKP